MLNYVKKTYVQDDWVEWGAMILIKLLNGGKYSELEQMSDERLCTVFGGKERIALLTKHFDILQGPTVLKV